MTARVIALANQKGGVGKTTTTLNVAAALAELGQAVLVVDLDPQACLTFSMGYDPDDLDPTLHDVIVGRVDLAQTVRQHEEMDVAPANIDLAGAEVTLLSRTGREYLLRGELGELLDSYDTVLVDCAPSLGVLTINGLTAADEVIIPVQCETLSHRGVAQLLDTISDVRRLTNRSLEIRGMVVTMFDPRTRHGREVLRDLIARYELELIGPPVRKSVRFAEAPLEGQSLLAAGTDVPGAAAYRAIARELLGLPVEEALLEAAGWSREQRGEILGVDGGSDGATDDSAEPADPPVSDDEPVEAAADPPSSNGDGEVSGATTDDDAVDDGDDGGELTVVDLDAREGTRG